ncbi:MAG: enoyl-CoA hydratase-related protein, partial [Acidimicrobiia bacterium]
MTVPSTLDLDTSYPGIAVLRLNRPERLNALDEVMVRELQEACAALGIDQVVRVVVLTGAGRGFCSGVDMRDFGPSMPDAVDPVVDRLRHQERMAALPVALRALPQPVIAAVNGPAVGGGLALCLAADVRLCAASASFANGAILVGLSGGEMGMSYLLPRIVGTSVAADWMLTGR